MKAIQLHATGGPEQLKSLACDEPVIRRDTDIKVRVKAAGINPVDGKLRSGALPVNRLPLIPGCDAAGIVTETGASASRFRPGDKVYYFYGGVDGINGNYAEYQVLDERFVAAMPSTLDFIHAAALPLVLLTAWEALFDRGHLQAGQTIFINAGTGGVGHIAIQLARHAGANVITTVSNDSKAEFARQLGADVILDYHKDDIRDAVMRYTSGAGVDIALDNVGGKQTETLFPLVKCYGDVVSLLLPDAALDWSVARMRNQRFCQELMLAPLLLGLEDAQRHQTSILERAAGLVAENRVTVHVSQVFTLEQAAEAHRLMDTGHNMGKRVLVV